MPKKNKLKASCLVLFLVVSLFFLTFSISEVSATINVRKIIELFTLSDPITTNVVSDVSLEHFEIELEDIIFNSVTYVPIFNGTVNLSMPEHITFKGVAGASKTGGGSGELDMRLTWNGAVLFDQTVRTISGPNDLGVFNFPLSEDVGLLGENNLTLEVKDSGTVNITNLKLFGDTDRSNAHFQVNNSLVNYSGTFSSISFINIANFTLNKDQNSTSIIDVVHKFGKEGATATTPSCYLKNNVTAEQTPTYTRYLSGPTDTGSSGINYRSSTATDGKEDWQLFCLSSDTDTITNNVTFYGFSTVDSNTNSIEGFQNNTEVNGVTGTTSILSYTDYVVQNSSEIELLATVNLQSTSGPQTGATSPFIKVNSSTAPESSCSNSYQRSLSTNVDIGTVKIYVSCEDLSVGEIHSFDIFLIVAGGETVNILNASLSSYEAIPLNITSGIVPPLVVIIYPTNGSSVNNTISINASVTDLSDQGWKSNVSLLNSDLSFNTTLYLNATNTNITNVTFDTTAFIDGDYAITWTVTEDAGSDSNTIYITIDNPFFYTVNATEQFSIDSLVEKIKTIVVSISEAFNINSSVSRLVELYSTVDVILPNTKTVPYVQLGQTLNFPDRYTYPYITLNGQ